MQKSAHQGRGRPRSRRLWREPQITGTGPSPPLSWIGVAIRISDLEKLNGSAMKTETSQPTPPPAVPQSRLPLKGWALELARRWNGGTYSLFILHGNIFDLFPVQDNSHLSYVPLKTFLVRRLFPERACLL